MGLSYLQEHDLQRREPERVHFERRLHEPDSGELMLLGDLRPKKNLKYKFPPVEFLFVFALLDL